MINFVEILKTLDKNNHIHCKTINILYDIKDFRLIKKWLIENVKETDIKFIIFKQKIEFFKFCVCGIGRINLEKSELQENVILSAVGYERH